MNDEELANEVVDHATSTSVPEKISKNQLRKLRKKERWESIKVMKKEKKRKQKELNLTENQTEKKANSSTDRRPLSEDERTKRKEEERLNFLNLCSQSFAIVVDCAWESEHAEGPLKSLAQQILFCYGLNKRSQNPSYFYITSIQEKLKSQLSKSHFEDWMGVISTEKDYTDVIKDKKFVYLTSDATDTLRSLDPSCAYIIGGIVDRNRLKGATLRKAQLQNIQTAKLPLREYCTLTSSPVLTVNHVFEILLRFAESNSWVDAFEAVLPGRKKAVTPIQSSIDSDISESKKNHVDSLETTNT